MLDFFADLMIITGGIFCVLFWILFIGFTAIEISDNIRERKQRELVEEGGAEGSDP